MVINFENYLRFLLVMLRFTGMIFFNPIFSRQNVPGMVRAGLAFTLAILVSPSVSADLPEVYLLEFLYLVIKELLVGLAAGTIFRLFLSAILVGGDKIDMQIGISMAKAFDPASNTSIAMSAQYINIMFYMTFFLSGAHLTLIRLTARSFEILPLGSYLINPDSLYLIPELFGLILLLAIKLALPMIVVEVIVTFAVGMIMRIVPQINVFVLNIQIKLIVGIVLLVLLVPSFMGYVENLIVLCYENIFDYWSTLGAPMPIP